MSPHTSVPHGDDAEVAVALAPLVTLPRDQGAATARLLLALEVNRGAAEALRPLALFSRVGLGLNSCLFRKQQTASPARS